MSSDKWQLGVYTPDQAARLLHLQPRAIRRWVYGTQNAQAAIIPEWPGHVGKLITFLDFVQAMAIRDIRNQRRISLQKIRQTVEIAEHNKVHLPFARKHTDY